VERVSCLIERDRGKEGHVLIKDYR